jgi:hypothetical protein
MIKNILSSPQRFFLGYYLATPVFMLIDYVCGANVRAAGFEAYPILKYSYYAACFLGFFVIRAKPDIASFYVLGESTVSIVSLIVGFLTPMYALLDQIEVSGAGLSNPMTAERITNFIISGSVACLAFQKSVR